MEGDYVADPRLSSRRTTRRNQASSSKYPTSTGQCTSSPPGYRRGLGLPSHRRGHLELGFQLDDLAAERLQLPSHLGGDRWQGFDEG